MKLHMIPAAERAAEGGAPYEPAEGGAPCEPAEGGAPCEPAESGAQFCFSLVANGDTSRSTGDAGISSCDRATHG